MGDGGRLAGRRAIVTGAGTGIGRSVAIAFGNEGAGVGLVGRREEPLREAAAQITASGGTAIVLPADVTREAEIEAAILSAERHLGGLDTIVGVAGIELYGGRGDDRVDRVEVAAWQA